MLILGWSRLLWVNAFLQGPLPLLASPLPTFRLVPEIVWHELPTSSKNIILKLKEIIAPQAARNRTKSEVFKP